MTFQRLRTALARLAGLTLTVVLVGCLSVFGLIALGPHVFGYRTATMLTGSMEPGITPGDVIVSVPRPAAEVEVGDVISYHIPVEDHRVETHRVIEVIHNEDGTVAVRTQGDANEAPDPWTATLRGDTVWEMKGVVPWLGNGIRTLRDPFIQQKVFWGALALMLLVGLSMIWGRDQDDEGDDEEGVLEPASAVPDASRATYLAALSTLSEELDEEYAVVYAGKWNDLLPRRIERVRTTVDARDATDALDAVLSLKVSSASVGAADLSDVSALLEAAVREGDWSLAEGLAAGLPGLAERSRDELSACLAA